MAQKRRNKSQPRQADRRGRAAHPADGNIEVIIIDRRPGEPRQCKPGAVKEGLGACSLFLSAMLAFFPALAALAALATAAWACLPSVLAVLEAAAAVYAAHGAFQGLATHAAGEQSWLGRPPEETLSAACAGAECSGHLARAALVAAAACRAAHALSGGLPDAATRAFGALAVSLGALATLAGLRTVVSAGSWRGGGALAAGVGVAWACGGARRAAAVRLLLPREGLVVAAVAAGLACALAARLLARGQPRTREPRYEVHIRRS